MPAAEGHDGSPSPDRAQAAQRASWDALWRLLLRPGSPPPDPDTDGRLETPEREEAP